MDKKAFLRKIELTSLALISILGANVKTIPIINKNNPLVITNEIKAAKKQDYQTGGSKEDGTVWETYHIGNISYYINSNYKDNKLIYKLTEKSISYDQSKLGLSMNAEAEKGTCTIYDKYKNIGGKYTYTQKTTMNGMWGAQDLGCSLDAFFSGKVKKDTISSSKKVTKQYQITFTPLPDNSAAEYGVYWIFPKTKSTLLSTTTITGLKSTKLVKGSKKIVRKYDANGKVKSKISYKYNGKKWIKTS